ncbi:ABC transporter substrate-binding protein [Naumannella huperziae]
MRILRKFLTGPRRALLAGVAGAAALTLAACGANSNPMADPTAGEAPAGGEVVVGSANFTESAIIAELYAGAMRGAGVNASTRTNIGSREIYIGALRDGSVSMVPEYTGNLLEYLDPESGAKDREDVDRDLPKVAEEQSLKVLDQSKAANQDVYVVTQQTAQESGVRSLADLAGKSDRWVLGGPGELADRPYGPKGLEDVYDAKFGEFRAYDALAVKVKDMNDGKVQVADFFSTDSAIADNNYVVLEDPAGLILPQNVVPLTRADFTDDAAITAVNKVQQQLTTEDLQALNAQVDNDHLNPDQVAADYLQSKGLGGS